jgi:acyl-CoA reductase-like NAD-dependent aldehyde dehydrogenase
VVIVVVVVVVIVVVVVVVVVAVGGVLPDREGQFYPPTVLTGVKKGMKIWEEEVFGPVRHPF